MGQRLFISHKRAAHLSDFWSHPQQLWPLSWLLIGVSELFDVQHLTNRPRPRFELVIDVMPGRTSCQRRVVRTAVRVFSFLFGLPVSPNFVDETMVQEKNRVVWRCHGLHIAAYTQMNTVMELRSWHLDPRVAPGHDPPLEAIPEANGEWASIIGRRVVENPSQGHFDVFARRQGRHGFAKEAFQPHTEQALVWVCRNRPISALVSERSGGHPVGLGIRDVLAGLTSPGKSTFLAAFCSLSSVTSTVIVVPGYGGCSRSSTIHPSSETFLISLKSLSQASVLSLSLRSVGYAEWVTHHNGAQARSAGQCVEVFLNDEPIIPAVSNLELQRLDLVLDPVCPME